jgi:hypothetical protein
MVHITRRTYLRMVNSGKELGIRDWELGGRELGKTILFVLP